MVFAPNVFGNGVRNTERTRGKIDKRGLGLGEAAVFHGDAIEDVEHQSEDLWGGAEVLGELVG